MNIDFCVTTEAMAEPAVGRTAELERLGDEIAELSAHLDAATAHLLDLIREFDAAAAGTPASAPAPRCCRGAWVSIRARPASASAWRARSARCRGWLRRSPAASSRMRR